MLSPSTTVLGDMQYSKESRISLNGELLATCIHAIHDLSSRSPIFGDDIDIHDRVSHGPHMIKLAEEMTRYHFTFSTKL